MVKPLLPVQGRRRSVQARVLPLFASGALLLASAAGLHGSLSFAVAPATGAARSLGPWVAASARERMSAPRSEAAARTQMQGRYSEGGRSRKNNQGGGRLPIRVSRKPVLGYAMMGNGQTDSTEPGGRVLLRMWEMYDMDFNRMVAIRQRYFRPGYRSAKWTADYNMRMGRRKKEQRIKRQYEEDWQDWMRREGRTQGLTDPIVYNGPPLAKYMEKGGELDKWTDPENFKKTLPGEDEMVEFLKKAPRGRAAVPQEMEDGKWNDDGDDNIFKIWRRPLCKWPYDIGKRGKVGPVVRGIVM